MDKLVLDSNVYISAAVYGGTPRKLFRFITKEPFFILFVSSKIREEVIKVLCVKFYFSEQEIDIFCRLAWEKAVYLQPSAQVNICRDPNDNHILALAREAKANFIVTGDKDLLVLEHYQNIKIINPADFLALKPWSS